VVAIAAIAAAVGIVAVAMSGAGSSSGSQTVEMVGTSVYGVSSRVTTMLAEKDELSEEDITFLRHYDQCQSCLVTCDHFEENHCDAFEPKQACGWDELLEECDSCPNKGCAHTIAYMQNNQAWNETFGDDDEKKAEAMEEMAWRTACSSSVDDFPKFEECIHDATTVSHAENCLKHFLHPMPANLLSMAKKIAATVGPPQCAMSYTGHECSPAPSPEDHEGTCPQGFMCMPDPSKCEECACSCNTPADKLKNLEACLSKAGNPHAGAFCLSTFFSQLPPAFVDSAIEASMQPKGVDEHYDQIVASCGGADNDNSTGTVTKCLEAVEYCVRPKQGAAGTFPDDADKFQPICECFRDEDVLKECAADPEAETASEEAEECVGAIREHYVFHVHNTYCKDQTEVACKFQCQWPLPGFFGDVAKKAEEEIKKQEKEAKEAEKEAAEEAEKEAAAAK